MPEGTSIELFYSLDEGENYISIGKEPGNFYLPSGSEAYSIMYKAVLNTDDPSITPSLTRVDIGFAQKNNNLFGLSAFISLYLYLSVL